MSRAARKMSKRYTREDFLNKKRMKSLVKLWADDEKEIQRYMSIAGLMIPEKGIIQTRIYFIKEELEKCKIAGLIRDPERIISLLTSNDPEMVVMAQDILFSLREKRLNDGTI